MQFADGSTTGYKVRPRKLFWPPPAGDKRASHLVEPQPPSDQHVLVGIYLARVERHARNIQEAFKLGVAPGTEATPWSPEVMRRWIDLHAEVLSRDYMKNLGANYLRCAATFPASQAPHSIRDDWSIVEAFWRSAGTALLEGSGHGVVIDLKRLPEAIDPIPPAVVRYDAVAQLLTSDGVERLRQSAKRSINQLALLAVPVSAEERAWLRDLHSGLTVADLAEKRGYSKRTMQRRLKQVWARLDADSREQGMTTASTLGLLDPD